MSQCPCMGISDMCGRLLDKLIGLHGKAGFKDDIVESRSSTCG